MSNKYKQELERLEQQKIEEMIYNQKIEENREILINLTYYMPHISVIGCIFCFFTNNYFTCVIWFVILIIGLIYNYLFSAHWVISLILCLFIYPLLSIFFAYEIKQYILNKEATQVYCAKVSNIYDNTRKEGYPLYLTLEQFSYEIPYPTKLYPAVDIDDEVCIQYTINSKWERYNSGLYILKINHKRYF